MAKGKINFDNLSFFENFYFYCYFRKSDKKRYDSLVKKASSLAVVGPLLYN